MKLHHKLLFSLFLTHSFLNPLSAEVQEITISWTPLLCKDSCIKQLDKEYHSLTGVDTVTINQQAGKAILTWKPKVPFLFTTLNSTMHRVGLSMTSVYLKVRGTLRHRGTTAFIISNQDNTRFELLSPLDPKQIGQVPDANYTVHKLQKDLMQKLIEGEKQKSIAVVEGLIFMPERMANPTQIVVDKISFETVPEKKT